MDHTLTKVYVVLRALERGLEVKLGDYTYALCDTLDGRPCIALKMQRIHGDGSTEDVYHDADLSVTEFIRMCNSLPELDASLLNANAALNSIRRVR